MAKKIGIETEITVRDNADASIARLRELRKEIRNVAAGSEDFRTLRAEMDDIEDALKTGRTAAGNFVEVLDQVPGPIGDIAGQGARAIDVLKSFGNLKFADLRASIIALAGDLKQAGAGLLRLTGITRAYTIVNDFLAASFVKVGIAEGAATAGARAFSAALVATGIGAILVGLGLLVNYLMSIGDEAESASVSISKLTKELDNLNEAITEGEAQLKRDQDLSLARLKKNNATNAQLREEDIKNLLAYKDLYGDLIEQADRAALEAELKFKQYKARKFKDEDIKQAEDELKRAKKLRFDLGQKILDVNNQIEIRQIENDAENRKEAFEKEKGDLDKKYQYRIDLAKIKGEEVLTLELEALNAQLNLLNKFGQDTENVEMKISLKKEEIKQKELDKLRGYQDDYETYVKDVREQELKAQEEFNQRTQEEYQQSTQNLQDYYNKQYEIINQQFANGELTQEEYDNMIFAKEEEHLNSLLTLQQDYAMSSTAIELQKSQRAAQIQSERIQKERELLINGSQTILGDLSALAAASEGKSEESRKRAFNQQKALAIASTVIGTYDSAQRAYTSQLIPGDPTSPIRATIAAGIAVASGLIRLAVIQKQKFEPNAGGGTEGGAATPQPSKFKDGGFVRGRLHANGGVMTSAGEIEGGEFVVNRAATAAFLPLLESINSQGIGVNVSRGNLSPTSEMSQPAQAPVIKTYVVASDVTSAQEANKRIQNLARL